MKIRPSPRTLSRRGPEDMDGAAVTDRKAKGNREHGASMGFVTFVGFTCQ